MSLCLDLNEFPINGSKEMQLLHLQWEKFSQPPDIPELKKNCQDDDIQSIIGEYDIDILIQPIDAEVGEIQRREDIQRYTSNLVCGNSTKKMKFVGKSPNFPDGSMRHYVTLEFARQVQGTLQEAIEEVDEEVKNGMIRDMLDIAQQLLYEYSEDEEK